MNNKAKQLLATEAVICIGGPYDGSGFSPAEWAARIAVGGAAALYEPGGEVPKRISSAFGPGLITAVRWPDRAVPPAVQRQPNLGDVDAVLGDPCPECGWRRDQHRPEAQIGEVYVPPCSRGWVTGG